MLETPLNPYPENQKLLMQINTQIGVIDTKLEYMSRDFKQLKEELSTKYTGLETTVNTDHEYLRDFQVIWKFVVGGSAAIGGIIAFVMTVAVNSLKLASK